MRSSDLEVLLKNVHDSFPLPEDFLGTHHFHLDRKTGKLALTVWFSDQSDEVNSANFSFDEDEPIVASDLREIFEKAVEEGVL